MTDIKSVFASRTVWGALISLAATLAGLAGFGISAADQTAANDLLAQIIGEWDRLAAIFGAALALWGRIRATHRLM